MVNEFGQYFKKNLVDVGEFNGRRLYTGLNRLCAPTSASCAISAVAELLVENARVF